MNTKRLMKTSMGAAGGVALGTAAALVAGTLLWRRSSGDAFDRLAELAGPAQTGAFHVERLIGLPEVVANYFKFALSEGQSFIEKATIRQRGEFRSAPSASWHPFTAEQLVTVNPPGFVWNATIRMMPFIDICVRDNYVGRAAKMQGKVASLATVIDAHDRPDLDAAALHRYLAEAVWYPTALLPGENVKWDAIDDKTARATLTDGDSSVSLQFQFNEKGEIVRAFTAERFREVGGCSVSTPWVCHYSNYRRIHGMMIPSQGEVEWLLPECRFSYWRGELDIDYQWNRKQL